jgi:hydroxymethylglutaryl-CoA lyase
MTASKDLHLVECPRDAMQGWPYQIPTEEKIRYIDLLLQAGFHTLDYGSFVSPRAIPQMADTEVVTRSIVSKYQTKLLAIIANLRGAQQACTHEIVDLLGFPFSISETFQQRNTNSGIEQSFETVKEIRKLCVGHKKELVVYLSMGFGNPYGDPYDEAVISSWIEKFSKMGVRILSIADTVGLADPEQVYRILKNVLPTFPEMEIGVHLHSTPEGLEEKIMAAYEAGTRRFDGALKGIGGCPMAGNSLVGNIDTESMIHVFESKGIKTGIDKEALTKASAFANRIFRDHAIQG